MKKRTFTNTLNKTEFKKLINYHLSGRGKVKRISTLNKDYVIFEVLATNNHVHNISFCYIQSVFASPSRGKMIATYVCKASELKYILNEIDFFSRSPNEKEKRNYPTINIKN